MRTYTRKQIVEAINYWRKQKMLLEGNDGLRIDQYILFSNAMKQNNLEEITSAINQPAPNNRPQLVEYFDDQFDKSIRKPSTPIAELEKYILEPVVYYKNIIVCYSKKANRSTQTIVDFLYHLNTDLNVQTITDINAILILEGYEENKIGNDRLIKFINGMLANDIYAGVNDANKGGWDYDLHLQRIRVVTSIEHIAGGGRDVVAFHTSKIEQIKQANDDLNTDLTVSRMLHEKDDDLAIARSMLHEKDDVDEIESIYR